MALHLSPDLRLFSTIAIIFILVQVPTSVSTIDAKYQNCSTPFRCANLENLEYPFWGAGRPEFCGHPVYELICQGEVAEITIMANNYGVIYRVLEVNNDSWTLTVAIEDYWDNICPTSPVTGTIDPRFFNYTPDTENVTLYYGCPPLGDDISVLLPLKFNCSPEETDTNNYYFIWGDDAANSMLTDHVIAAISIYFGGCARNVTIPGRLSALPFLNHTAAANVSEALREGFDLQWNANNSLFDKCKNSGGLCGYDPDTDEFTCYCRDKPYPLTCSSKGASSKKKSFFNNLWKIAVGIIASMLGMGTIIIILSKVGMGQLWKKKTEDDQRMEAFIRNCGSHAPRRYTFSDVRNITKSFNEKLGQGGYGNVYKGKLPDGRLVAVKILKESKGNGEEFINEVASMSRTSHVNIVSLLGFCCEKNKRALIYEFMCNGSLDKFTCDTESSTTNCNLEWKTLYQIAIGIARGLEYLHKGCNIRIVHFDIKPHNILLDEDFYPKISDFGLAKQSNQKDSIMSMLHTRGTVGYIAPEMFYRRFGGVSYKSDVYSYGMMILKIVGARKNIGIRVSQTSEIYFPDSIYNLLELGKDFDLPSLVTEEEKETAKRMILVSLWCIQTNPSDRPSMTKVVEMLEGRPEKLQIPPKPYWSSPPRSPELSLPASLSTQLTSEYEML